MSLKIGRENLQNGAFGGHVKDSYGLPVQDGVPTLAEPKPASPQKSYGVRIPVLRDLDGKYIGRRNPTSCRFDIVEKVTTVIKAGAYGPSNSDADLTGDTSPRHSDEHLIKRISRHPTFHSTLSNSTRQSDQKDTSVLERIGPYHWNQWVKPSKEGDARDVLYRNTYCQVPEHVRYRTMTLPRISTAASKERPWTVAGDEKPCVNKADHGEYSKVVTIVPQQPRGTIVRFREYMKPVVRESDGRPMEVKRVNTKPVQNNHFTTIKSGFPVIKHDSRISQRKSERPLKFENARYIKKYKETLYTKHVLPAYKNAFDRDYSSADTFKEYLESLQQTAKANTPGMHIREWTNANTDVKRQSVDYHNRVLQSVSDVNQPDEDPHEISVEIKQGKQVKQSGETINTGEVQKQIAIDNLSSVHGSVVRAHSDTHSVTVPRSSSIVDGKSVVKIPSVITEPLNVVNQETDDNPAEGLDYVDGGVNSNTAYGKLKREVTVDVPCPTNTPTPENGD